MTFLIWFRAGYTFRPSLTQQMQRLPAGRLQVQHLTTRFHPDWLGPWVRSTPSVGLCLPCHRKGGRCVLLIPPAWVRRCGV